MLQGHGAIVNQGLESLSVIALKHKLDLFLTFVVVIRLFKLNVKGIQAIKGPGIEGFPVLWLINWIKMESGGFPVGMGMQRCHNLSYMYAGNAIYTLTAKMVLND